jgi:hypothetical protein
MIMESTRILELFDIRVHPPAVDGSYEGRGMAA